MGRINSKILWGKECLLKGSKKGGDTEEIRKCSVLVIYREDSDQQSCQP